jgi:hypothetical protein
MLAHDASVGTVVSFVEKHTIPREFITGRHQARRNDKKKCEYMHHRSDLNIALFQSLRQT